jgi:hypothetical protein
MFVLDKENVDVNPGVIRRKWEKGEGGANTNPGTGEGEAWVGRKEQEWVRKEGDSECLHGRERSWT